MTPRTAHSIRTVLLVCCAFYALAAFILPPLLAWALENPVFTLTLAACGGALGMYWFRYRHELE